jgi:soluble lytic murein transglycosylase
VEEGDLMRVPSYDNLQVGANTLPTPNFRPATFDSRQPEGLQPVKGITTPDIAGKQLQETGNALQRMGSQIAAIQIDAQREADQVRVDDALNKAREASLRLTYDKDQGYTNLKGLSALERPNGLSLEDEYVGNWRKERDGISSGLSTEAQKKLFAEKSADMEIQLRAGIMRHTSGEYQGYQLSIADGIQATAIDDIGKNFRDTKAVEGAVDRIKAEVYRQAKLTGKSAEWQDAKARDATSKAHKVALMAALEANDPEYAQGYLKQFSGQMEAADMLHVGDLIDKEMKTRVGMKVADDVMRGFATDVAPTEADRAFNILLGTESGGKQFGKDGKPLTSKAGAIGIAQVMPATGPIAAKIAGIPWDENRYRNDPEYNKALGKAYFAQQLKDFGGRLDMAYAAYNAGPGRLKQAIAQASKEGGDWINHVPKETQDYVAKNMGEYRSGSGKGKTPTLEEIDKALRADPRVKDPESYKVARASIEKQYSDTLKAQKQRDDDAVNTALDMVEKNGGSYANLPLNVRNLIPPDKRDTVMSFAEKVAKGVEVKTDPEVYYGLSFAAANDPEIFKGRDLRQYFPQLSPSDRKHFIDLQGKKQEELLDHSTLEGQKSDLVASLKLDKVKAGLFSIEADKALRAAESAKGKKLTQEERQKELDKLVLRGSESGWFSSSMYQFEANAKGRSIDIQLTDDQQRKSAFEALKRRGIANPTNQQVADTLKMLEESKKKQSGATGAF